MEPALLQPLWPLPPLALALLVALLILRRSYRTHPAFFFYAAVILMRSVMLHLVYSVGNFSSATASRADWISGAVALAARAAVLIELCRTVLAPFRGLWALASRILIFSASLVLLSTLIFALQERAPIFAAADLAAELAIAVVVVLLLLFVRYYEVPAPAPFFLIATGLCFHSCVFALKDALLQSGFALHSIWNAFDDLALLACAMLWFYAFCARPACLSKQRVSLDRAIYFQISPQINSRLKLLNEHLARLCKIQATRP